MFQFIRGFLVEISKWNLKKPKSKVIHNLKFVPEFEMEAFKELLKTNNYHNPSSHIFYKLDDDFLEVIQIKGILPKSYLYNDNCVEFWNKEIDIIKISDKAIDEYLEDIPDKYKNIPK